MATSAPVDSRHRTAKVASPTLLSQLLREQQELTVVGKFSQWHEQETTPLQEPYYRELIPLSLPQAGEQFAFQVDLDSCSGCKACVTACHSLNGLEENEIWREVGLLQGGPVELPILQSVTTACHHCVEPGCLEGCPVKAYDKDPVTGIVRHLDDQCIGCQYCILMCPYEVPKYSPSKGIVRKCDMCQQRLSGGEAPACVQACPNQAIRIEIVRQDTAREFAAANRFLPASPSPTLTIPTTQFISKRGLAANLISGDAGLDHPAHAHPPLVAMLVLTQLSVGLIFVERLLSLFGPSTVSNSSDEGSGSASYQFWLWLATLVTGISGGMAAQLHLGRPQIAFRAWLGWRTSWLSREIIAFGLYGGAASGLVALATLAPAQMSGQWLGLVAWMTLAAGAIGLFCSAMIYAATRRPFWNLARSGSKFACTAMLLGLAGTITLGAAYNASHIGTASGIPLHGLLLLLPVVAFAKLMFEGEVLSASQQESDPNRPLSRTAKLLTNELRDFLGVRLALGVLGGIAIPLLLVISGYSQLGDNAAGMEVSCGLVAILLVAGELLERYLFFTAVVAPRMPGAPQQ